MGKCSLALAGVLGVAFIFPLTVEAAHSGNIILATIGFIGTMISLAFILFAAK